MAKLDIFTERLVRSAARKSSRRGILGFIGAGLTGAALTPVLPISRAAAQNAHGGGSGESAPIPPQSSGTLQDPGDQTSCDYWRYCAIDGFLCSCCGGSVAQCPPGTEMSPITWIGTCENPADGRSYIISYNDCCGRSSCGRCLCNTNENDRPIVRPQASNDINWCLGTQSAVYNCSTAVILGTALEE